MANYKNYEELTHAWAYAGEEEEGQTPGGRMYYSRGTIYSYGSHFPIAKKYYKVGSNKSVILFTSDSYSSTTAKHISHTRGAIPHSWDKCVVPEVCISNPFYSRSVPKYMRESWANKHIINLKHMEGRLLEDLGKLARARTNVDQYHVGIDNTKTNFSDYVSFFELREAPKKYKALHTQIADIDALIDKIAMDLNTTAAEVKSIQKRVTEAEKAKKDKAQRKWERLNRADVKAWKAGKIETCPGFYGSVTYLRIKEEEVQTSRGVTVPLKHALIMYKRHKAGKQVTGHSIGHYRIDKVNKKEVVIGCHSLPMKEIERIMKGA